ncbi:GNAT family N-acetyltransferase [Photobacterium sanctipauli]|nr:GNAT family N-acetyltransferase [Photobacterium sanctipauli]
MIHLVSDCTHLTRCPKLLVRITWRDANYLGQLYVKTQYHGQGIAKQLVDEMKQLSHAEVIQVKASIYAVGFYSRVGFQPTDQEQSINGIRYIPMELVVKQPMSST